MNPHTALKGQCPGADFLPVASSACENWCYHIWIQYEKSFSRHHEKTVSTLETRSHSTKEDIQKSWTHTVRAWMKLENIFFTLIHDMEKVYTWFACNSMKANPDEFQFVILDQFVTLTYR